MTRRPVLLDVDGVCADFLPPLISAIDDPLIRSPDDIKRWNFFDGLSKSSLIKAYRVCADPEFWRSLPVILGARAGVAKIYSEGYRIKYVTTAWPGCATWADEREEWLTRFDPRFVQKRLHVTDRKEVVLGHCLIDDRPRNVCHWTQRQRKHALLYEQPYNAQFRAKYSHVLTFTWRRYLQDDMTLDKMMAGNT